MLGAETERRRLTRGASVWASVPALELSFPSRELQASGANKAHSSEMLPKLSVHGDCSVVF